MTASQMATVRAGLLEIAKARGFNPGSVQIFIETLESAPKAFKKLNDKLTASGPRTVILPGANQLSGLGAPPIAVIQAFSAIGVDVLIVGQVVG